MLLLLKALVPGHMRAGKDGTVYVRPYVTATAPRKTVLKHNQGHVPSVDIEHRTADVTQFGIDESGQAYIESPRFPDRDQVGREIDRWFAPFGPDVYVRGSISPDDMKHLAAGTHRGSRNHATGQDEGGLSVAYRSEFPAKHNYLVTGARVGSGSDWEPLLDHRTAKPVSGNLSFGQVKDRELRATAKRLAKLGMSEEAWRLLQSAHKRIVPAGKPLTHNRIV